MTPTLLRRVLKPTLAQSDPAPASALVEFVWPVTDREPKTHHDATPARVFVQFLTFAYYRHFFRQTRLCCPQETLQKRLRLHALPDIFDVTLVDPEVAYDILALDLDAPGSALMPPHVTPPRDWFVLGTPAQVRAFSHQTRDLNQHRVLTPCVCPGPNGPLAMCFCLYPE